MSAAGVVWVGVGASRRHEQEGGLYQIWHGYSFVRVMNSVNEASLAAAGIRMTLPWVPSSFPVFYTRNAHPLYSA